MVKKKVKLQLHNISLGVKSTGRWWGGDLPLGQKMSPFKHADI